MPKIMIDAGHGGKDVGAIGKTGVYEKDLNLQVALKLQSKLNGLIDIIMTRITDIDVSFDERVKLANDKNVDLYVSIHHNSFKGNQYGFEIIINKGSVLGYRFASLLVDEYRKVHTSHGVPIKQWNDAYIRNTECPSIFSEFCFIDSDDIKNFEVEKEAQALFNAIVKYFDIKIAPPSPPVPSIEQWKIDGAKYLLNSGYTKNLHKPDEIIDIGTLGAIMKNQDDKAKKIFDEMCNRLKAYGVI